MTKYCKCGHKKSEHSSRLGEVDFTGVACDGGIFHHRQEMYYAYGHWSPKETIQLDNCLCPKFRLSRHQKYQAKRWKNTIVYDKTRGLVESGMGKYPPRCRSMEFGR